MKIHHFFIVCLLLLVSRANAYFGYGLLRCQFSSTRDVVYLEEFFFNKKLLGEFNSTVGKYVAFEKHLEPIAKLMNTEEILAHTVRNKKWCESKISVVYDVLSTPVEPSVHLRLVKEGDDEHRGTLVCSAYNFHPKDIKVTWLRNGEEVKSNVTFTEELENGNWVYQVNSHLNINIRSGEQISCKVEHISLKEPELYLWDPVLPSETMKIAAGSTGLLIGLTFLITGLIVYTKRTNGWERTPTTSATR